MNNADYQFPPLGIFDEPAEPVTSEETDRALLEHMLQTFNVSAKVVGYHRGPAVTRYIVQPGARTRIAEFERINRDLALALAVNAISIQQVDGTATIGIEVPNAVTEVVTLSAVLWRAVTAPLQLPIALGVDVAGDPVYADLARLVHLLVAGATGAGKSVLMKGMIATLLTALTPSELNLVMIDLKRVELSAFNGIPHLRGPVITERKKAVDTLEAICAEMDRRYVLFEEARVPDLASFNQASAAPLPYVVVVIDELQDLMLEDGKRVEAVLTRLSAMARATGIHLIVATQRPSVDVITGVVKANLPSRIALRTASHVDSNTILDQAGAERLKGQGDMLFWACDAQQPVRVQGALLTSREIGRLVGVLARNGSPGAPFETPVRPVGEEDHSIHLDERFSEAVAFVAKRGLASTDAIKQGLKVGHNRASRIMAQLEAQGIVEPGGSTKARKVIASALPALTGVA